MDFVKKAKKKIKKKLKYYLKTYKSKSADTIDDQLLEKKLMEDELNEMISYLGESDSDHVWAFNAGNSTNDFRGNPKYMFVYINYYRPDIKAYWICSDRAIIEQVRNLGFHAVCSGSPAASFAAERTGVAVTEQVRGYVPFRNAKYLNLWHGNGFKIVERKRIEDGDALRLELAKKYIMSNEVYQNQMILAVASDNQERLLGEYIGIPTEHMLRVGYARCTYQSKYKPIKTFDYDFISQRNLAEDTRIAVYAPTFRANKDNIFTEAIGSLDELSRVCEENHILLIFKMHPVMENEKGFKYAQEKYRDKKYLLFWDNVDDIYEIMNSIDLLIYDYSSIFSDFLLGGVKHYIRYLYDYDQMIENGSVISEEEYFNNSVGQICKTFSELLVELTEFEKNDDSRQIEDIMKRQWNYAGDDDFEKTIQAVMDFKIETKKYPTLYSFDVFDTLLSRKGLAPVSIFYAIRERMEEDCSFPARFQERFPDLRMNAEKNAREYMRKSQDQRESFHVEITLAQIYDRLREVYGLSDEQVDKLMRWEQEEEIHSVIPLPEQIMLVKKYLESGEHVVLISDMYLPKETITKMLEKADPVLATIPLFLSNEYGVLKTSRLLFFEVYRSFKPYYNYGKWIHCGDNINADQTQPRKLGIFTRHIDKIENSEIEQEMAKTIGTYDAFLLTGMQARLRDENRFAKADFVIDYVAPCFTSYVDWAIRDAMKKGYETLYFVSRDGDPLKRIADELIKAYQAPIKTKYIYASRRVWRIPSFIDDIDVDFWSNQGGNFNNITSKDKLLKALDIEDEETFNQIFPQINLEEIDFEDWRKGQPARELVPIMRKSEEYKAYLLKKAEEERVLVCKYLEQEIDASEKFAFVEFWGRGYNQLCHSRLWNHVIGKEVPTIYYYARTVHGTEGNCIRYNMTANATEFFFLESIFANMPYKSIEKYILNDGKVEPEIVPISNDKVLYEAMIRLLPEFARRYANLGCSHPEDLNRDVFDFCLDYYANNKQDPFIYNNIGPLVDSVSMYGDKVEFARPYTMEDLERFKNGEARGKQTMSMTISYMRSSEEFKKEYNELYQREEGDDPVGGKIISERLLEESQKYHDLYDEAVERCTKAQEYYSSACKETEIEKRIVVISESSSFSGDRTYSLKKCLEQQKVFDVKYVTSKCTPEEDVELMKLLATARYIITDCNPVQLSGVSFREGTEVIRLSDSGFQLYEKGTNLKHRLMWRKKYERLLYDINYTHIQVPGNELLKREVLEEYMLPASTVETYGGSSITDVYFDEEYRKSVREKVNRKYPDVKGKKIIFYLLAARKRAGNPNWLEMLDLMRLQSLLKDEYYLFIDVRNDKKLADSCMNQLNISGFSRVVPAKDFNLRNIACIADIIVGDYRDSFFETVLLSKPIYFTGFDVERETQKAISLYDLGKINPFPIVKTADEFADQLRDVEHYDFEPVNKFKELYFGDCDGKSAQRIVDSLIQQG